MRHKTSFAALPGAALLWATPVCAEPISRDCNAVSGEYLNIVQEPFSPGQVRGRLRAIAPYLHQPWTPTAIISLRGPTVTASIQVQWRNADFLSVYVAEARGGRIVRSRFIRAMRRNHVLDFSIRRSGSRIVFGMGGRVEMFDLSVADGAELRIGCAAAAFRFEELEWQSR